LTLKTPEPGAPLAVAPNPAGDEAWIRYQLKAEGPAALELYDVAGTRLKHWDLGSEAAGTNLIKVDLRLVPDGIYLLALRSQGSQGEVHFDTFKLAVHR
jgi:hypothetical protein